MLKVSVSVCNRWHLYIVPTHIHECVDAILEYLLGNVFNFIILRNDPYCYLEITEKPSLSKPDNVEIMEKEDAVFETEAFGKPDPDVEWFSGSVPLHPSNYVILEQDGDTHRLILKTCEVEQTGAIRVTATNKAGELTQEAMLTVKG